MGGDNRWLFAATAFTTTSFGRREILTFLETVQPSFLSKVPAVIHRQMWFEHDSAPAHYANAVRGYLTRKFGVQWIGRGGPISFSPRSLDLSPIDFFVILSLFCSMKNMLHETLVDSDMKHVVAAGNVQEMLGIFRNVRLSIQHRHQVCFAANCRNFERQP